METDMAKGYHQGTFTLAKIFAEQGHWEKAAEIYRNLLRQDPGRQDVAHALAEVEAALHSAGPTSGQTLAPLFQEWIDLLLQHDRLRKLRRFKARM